MSVQNTMTKGFKNYSNQGLRTTYQHFLGLQRIARKAGNEEVYSEVQDHKEAILKELDSRKVIL